MTQRLFLLCCALALALLVWALQQGFSLTGLQPRPLLCTPQEPDGARELLDIADDLGFAGVQLSLRDRDGSWSDCAAGWVDWRGAGEPMSVQHRLRYLSLSKVLTSAIAVRLAVKRQLDLDQRLVDLLGLDGPYADPRIRDVTLRYLLTHTGGFDRGVSGDPMMARWPWCPNRFEELVGVDLDFPPGQRFAYSNLGYCLLGKAIENQFDKPFATLVREELLLPANQPGIIPVLNGMQHPGEARLQIHPLESFDVLNSLDYEAMIATGAWSGTAADFGRLMEAVFLTPGGLLDADARSLLTDVAPNCDISRWRHCHGLGLYRHREGEGPVMHWRDGSLTGGTAFFAVSDDGQIAVWLANSRTPDWIAVNDRIGQAVYRFFWQNAISQSMSH